MISPSVRHERSAPWQNWSRSVRCVPDWTFSPSTVEEIASIVRFAVDSGRTLRVVGEGHSWSALVPTDDVLVRTERLDRVRLDLAEPEYPRVVIDAGAIVRQVNEVLEANGLALPFNVVLESVRFGGLISTGSHASGWNHQTLSDAVHAIEVVVASGAVRRFERGVDRDDVMAAVCLSLGSFGVIWRITLDVVRTFCVRAVDRRVPVATVLDHLAEWVPSHDNLDLFWWPFTDRLWVKTWDATPGPATAKPRSSRRDRYGAAVTSRLFDGMLASAVRVPRITPTLSRTAFLMTPSRGDKVVELVEAVHYRRSIEVARMGCLEVGFKVTPGFEGVRWAIEQVFETTARWAARGEYPINVTMNARFVHNSDCLLSPASGEGHTCYIEILGRAPAPQWEAFSAEVAAAWLTLPRARPHWAKEYRHLPGIIEHVRRAYGDDLTRFAKLRRELAVDPDDTFVNAAVAELLL